MAAPVVSVVAAGGSEGCVEGAAAVREVMNEGDGGGDGEQVKTVMVNGDSE